MLDSYLFGNVERISPEAPVPIIDITNKQDKLGGAANVAANIKNLGGTPILCSIIGNDINGSTFLELLEKLNISRDYIYKSDNRKTTSKTRIIGNNHQMLRIDEEIKYELETNQINIFLHSIEHAFNSNKIDCVLFQDYDKGILNKLIIDHITTYSNNLNIPIVVDPKNKNFSFYKNITLFKPNLKEFKEGLNLSKSIDKKELLETGSKILHKKGIKIVFVTLSEDGIFISYEKNNKIINKIIPGKSIDVVDVSGAGDTVASVISMLFGDLDIEEITKISNLAGGIVCEEVGVVPIEKEKLLKEYGNYNT